MDDYVDLDDRDVPAVVRSLEADIKALLALSAATLRMLEAASPAMFNGADETLKEEAEIAAKADPDTGAHVRALLHNLGRRLASKA